MTYDLYAWKAPRDLDAQSAGELIDGWQAAGGDPAESPFEPSTDVGWFYRELLNDAPGVDATSDAVAAQSKVPIWLATTEQPPARLVAMRVASPPPPDALEAIFGLAAKYDLVVFDARGRRVHLPLEEMAAYASATFWPRGAIQAAVAGAVGLGLAVAGWLLAIPLLGGILVIVGGFLFVMAVFTFVHEGRVAARARRQGGDSPPRR